MLRLNQSNLYLMKYELAKQLKTRWQELLQPLFHLGDGIRQMLIAAVIDNHDLNERDRAAPFRLLGGAVAVNRANVFDHIFLRHYVEVFHLLPRSSWGTEFAPLYRRR